MGDWLSCGRCRLSAALTFVSFWALLAAFVWLLAGSAPVRGASAGDGYSVYYVAPNRDCGGREPCYATIQAAVDAVDEPTDVIKVAAGTYSDLFARSEAWRQVVLILKPLTLRGGYSPSDWETSRPSTNRTVIDPRGGGRGVVVYNVPVTQTVTLEGLTIRNGNADGLGGYALEGAPLGDAGGGVYVYGSAVTIRNCELISNKATNSTFNQGFGGALFVFSGTVALQDNVFRDNVASTNYAGAGGAIGIVWSPRPSTISNNVVLHNIASLVADGFGGGIYLNSAQVALSGNVVEDNAAATRGIGRGGGLYAVDSGLTLSSNRVYSNTANVSASDGFGLGGGLYIERYDWQNVSTSEAITLTDNLVEHNVAARSGRGYGGGMLLRVTIADVRGNVVRYNVAGLAEGAGGGLFLGSSRALTRTTPARIAIAANTFQANRAAGSGAGKGGGVFIGVLPPVGGELDVIPAVTFSVNTILSNTASTNGEGRGGGLAVIGSGTRTARVISNTLQGNLASNASEGYGGGLYLELGEVNLAGNTLQGNRASAAAAGYGGGIWVERGGPRLAGNVLRENIASAAANGYGGGVGFRSSLPTLEGNQLRGNVASTAAAGWGGGLYAVVSELSLARELLQGNVASRATAGAGGGIYLDSCAYSSLQQSTLIQNAASAASGAESWGGGLYAANTAPLFLVNNIVGGNSARSEGGGLWLDGFGEVLLLHNTIAHNGSQGLYAEGSLSIVCTNTIVAGHTQAGVWIEAGSSLNMAYTLWHGNRVNRGGGGADRRSNDLSGDPDFVAPASGDFHLGPDSAALDRGVNAGVNVDIDGDTRPYGRGYDLGADEFTGGVAPKKRLYIPFLRR